MKVESKRKAHRFSQTSLLLCFHAKVDNHTSAPLSMQTKDVKRLRSKASCSKICINATMCACVYVCKLVWAPVRYCVIFSIINQRKCCSGSNNKKPHNNNTNTTYYLSARLDKCRVHESACHAADSNCSITLPLTSADCRTDSR